MSIIKKISVTVTYSVGLGEIKAPQNVIDELMKAYDNDDKLDAIDTKTIQNYSNAIDWLSDNIKERDCYDHSVEITDLEV
ncbi:hypothetical protein EGI16_03545 [Chryseobacterium sp. G0240]|uniref:hypothetical protein n=1 Tax=Chryseobacterium sp. G0240 TaxID=2487066 RepID=UPI000F458A3B|nr:hypothetical protein [Chryseobacterium sp. G0240]ROI05473.1 hypothetical protein EGI16_03545 [Chryseobacterium sp. G0240]